MCLAIALWDVTTRVQQSPNPPADILTIDGSKNPELLPEWFVWEKTLTMLARDVAASRVDSKALVKDLGIRDAELELLLKEARDEAERGERLYKELAPIGERMRAEGKSPLAILEVVVPLTFEGRRQTLEARGRLYSALSDESLWNLRNWIFVHIIQKTKITLHGSEARSFSFPW